MAAAAERVGLNGRRVALALYLLLALDFVSLVAVIAHG